MSGGVLLQADENGDWHPCSYLSNSFLPTERNYDVYDRELLGVINALKAWHHYLRGSPFPVQVFTDHKNLTYFRQAQHLNHRQARWLVDLTDFDLKFTHFPGTSLTAPDALSRQPDLCPETANDNSEVTLLSEAMFVRIIDCTLTAHIADASTNDLLVTKTLLAFNADAPSHLCSRLTDFQWCDKLLTYQGQVYIPPTRTLHHNVVSRCHNHASAGHLGYLKTHQLIAADYWWPGLAQFVRKYIEGCGDCQQAKVNMHPTMPPLAPFAHPHHNCSNNYLVISSLISPHPPASILSWLWSTMALQRG